MKTGQASAVISWTPAQAEVDRRVHPERRLVQVRQSRWASLICVGFLISEVHRQCSSALDSECALITISISLPGHYGHCHYLRFYRVWRGQLREHLPSKRRRILGGRAKFSTNHPQSPKAECALPSQMFQTFSNLSRTIKN